METEQTDAQVSSQRREKMTEGQKKADNFLKAIKNEDQTIRDMITKIEYLKYRAAGGGAIRYDKDHVQTTPEDILSSSMAEAVDLERKIREKKYEIGARRIKANKILYSWEDTEGLMLAYVLIIYYMENGTMRDVATRLDRSERQAYRMKLDALERFNNEFTQEDVE